MNFSASTYLRQIEQRYASELAELPAADDVALHTLIEQTSLLAADQHIAKALRRQKALFAYRWASARLQQTLAFSLLGQLQTLFAEATIDKALKAAWNSRQLTKIAPEDKRLGDGTVPGLFILGLGKLGGFDLNFSSDIDLVAFYDAESLPVPSMHGRTDVCSRALKEFTQIISKPIDGEFVWRVDWRLRPNASSMVLTMSTEVANDFYYFHSMPWHRLSMIKARAVAGDTDCGDQFLAELEPYLWRQNLDFQMIDEIQQLKSKINNEHPQLQRSRMSGELANPEIFRGANLKLGRGCIREIEFVANAMQLLWGGKKPLLRNRSTLEVLEQIAAQRLLPEDDARMLAAAYMDLRQLEDAVQILDNQQTQLVPEQEQSLSRLAELTGSEESTLQQKLLQHRKNVIRIFDDLFRIAPGQASRQQNADEGLVTPAWLEGLPARLQEIWQCWAEGFNCYAVSSSQVERVKPLFNKLAHLIDSDGLDRARAIDTIHQFLQAIPRGSQYLRLLVEQPNVANDILRPLLISPHMTLLLEQSPHIVDMLLEPTTATGESDPDLTAESEFVTQSPDFEIRLERLRRFVNEQLYANCLHLMQGKTGAEAISRRLTALAEHTLELGVAITNEEMGLESAPIGIVAMGKLGMGAMAPKSDLDLIFVAEDKVDLELASRYASRLQHLMDLRTREGRAYEMDMRLRPSGRSGPVTVSLASFCKHHLENAKTWEHIALCAGRPLAGSPGLLSAIAQLRATVLSRPRDQKQFELDAAKMLWRLQEQRIGQQNKDALDVKLRRGGLMEVDYLSACAILQTPLEAETYTSSYNKMLGAVLDVSRCSYLPDPPRKLFEILKFWRKLQIWSRVFGLESARFDTLDPELLEKLLLDMAADNAAELGDKINDLSSTMRNCVDAMQAEFERDKPADWQNWNEKPVAWL